MRLDIRTLTSLQNMRRLAVVDEFNSVQETITVHDIIKIGTNAEFDDQFRDKLTDFMPWAREWAVRLLSTLDGTCGVVDTVY